MSQGRSGRFFPGQQKALRARKAAGKGQATGIGTGKKATLARPQANHGESLTPAGAAFYPASWPSG